MIGTIVEFGVDGLGWIELDQGGQRVRFGHSACVGITREMFVPGTRVVVSGTEPGFRGVLKATSVRPLDPPPLVETAAAKRERSKITWGDLIANHSRFSDVDDVTLVPDVQLPAVSVAPPSIFEPWRAEIMRTMPTMVSLHVPDYQRPEPCEPGPADCFSHGNVAFLPQPLWPSCGRCARPLEMCIQLSQEAIMPWMPGRGGLCAMFCFHCGPTHDEAHDVAYVKFIQRATRVTCEPTTETASSSPRRETQRVTLAAPSRAVPGAAWYRYRAEKTPSTAASVIFKNASAELFGLQGHTSLEEVGDAFEAWTDTVPGVRWGGAALGGAPSWDQRDATPRCPHGEMKLLLQYEGGQFLDGALHVFVCGQCPEPRFVAEF